MNDPQKTMRVPPDTMVILDNGVTYAPDPALLEKVRRAKENLNGAGIDIGVDPIAADHQLREAGLDLADVLEAMLTGRCS